ncbi:hypothetical protein C8Q79DRAFT_916182 [Trametes meyenii]|nr:hypothetical protein C8Q79DRAFT_916182 [Trametes meyenii]
MDNLNFYRPTEKESGPGAVLDIDVLRLILEALPRASLLQMSFLSFSIRDEATRELLKRPICIRGHLGVQRFCLGFAMQSENLKRLTYVHQLRLEDMDVWNDRLTLKDRDALIKVLRHCSGLKKLALHNCKHLMDHDPRFLPMVESMDSLTHLDVRMFGLNASLQLSSTVMDMRSSLVCLRLPHISAQALASLMDNLTAVQSRLEDLYLRLPQDFSLNPGVLVPSVRTLHLEITAYDRFPPLHNLQLVFPSVRELTVTIFHYEARIVDQILPSNHDLSIRRRTLAIITDPWKSLKVLRANPPVAYFLDVGFPVYHLDIGVYIPVTHGTLVAVVSRVRPRRLTLNLLSAPGYEIVATKPSILLFGSDSGPGGVAQVFLKMCTDSPDSTLIHNIEDRIRPLLAGSRVEYLHLLFTNIQWHLDLDIDELLRPRDTLRLVEADVDIVQVIDVEALARTVMELCRSIRTIAITVLSIGTSVWRIDTIGDTRRLVKLELYYGRQLMEREEQKCAEGWDDTERFS